MIDSTHCARAVSSSAGGLKKDSENQAIGRSVGGVEPKIHALVDALGDPLAFYLTPGAHS